MVSMIHCCNLEKINLDSNGCTMGKTLLSEEMADHIENRVRNVWDINKAYWYPLFDCKRNDIIALAGNVKNRGCSKIAFYFKSSRWR